MPQVHGFLPVYGKVYRLKRTSEPMIPVCKGEGMAAKTKLKIADDAPRLRRRAEGVE